MERANRRSASWATRDLESELAGVPVLWALLGEAQSKCEHIGGVLIEPEVAAPLERLYRARGVAAITQTEGSPLSEEDVRAVIERRAIASPHDSTAEQQVRSIADAVTWLVYQAHAGRRPAITPSGIALLNQWVVQGSEGDDRSRVGPLSRNELPGSTLTHAVAPSGPCELQMQELCDFLRGDAFAMPEHLATARAILRAIIAHVQIVLARPFAAGNGETARLVELQILLSADVPVLAAQLLSTHYNETRRTYCRLLQATGDSSGSTADFVLYALGGFVSQLAEQIGVLREHQRDIAWEHHVASRFEGLTGKPARRQRELIGIISQLPTQGPLVASRLTAHSEVRALYAALDLKTLSRDIHELKRMKLLHAPEPGLVVANHDILKSLQVRHYPVRPKAEIA